MAGPARKREAVATVCQRLEVSGCRACRTLGQARSCLTAATRRMGAREPRVG
jgi:hypothetical protein